MKFKKTVVLFLLMLFSILFLPLKTYAAEPIDPEQIGSLTVSFQKDGKGVENAAFEVWKIADVDPYGKMSLTAAFASYPIRPENQDQEGWQKMAETLQGYVRRDRPETYAEGITGREGKFTIALKAGLYLILGGPVEKDGITLTPVPALVFFPEENAEENIWQYETKTEIKFTEEETTSLKVKKIWQDDGYEKQRPETVIVDLLCDGKVYASQELSEANAWQYEWTKLSAEHERLIVEREIPNYTVTVERKGKIVTLTNRYAIPEGSGDIPVVKYLGGLSVSRPADFTFILHAEGENDPMPENSTGRNKTITITGSGRTNFGTIHFNDPGTYTYTVQEVNDGVSGYTYDPTVYRVIFTVREEDSSLTVVRTVLDSNGSEVRCSTFTNTYHKPELPYTGISWWPIPALIIPAIVFLILGRNGKDDKQ